MESETLFGSLLRAKFVAPKLLDRELSRQRLLQILDRCLSYKLTIVTAPAGYGKTTLLGDWTAHAQETGCRVAWIHLDEDDDGFTFWEYFCAALAGVATELDFAWLGSINVGLDRTNPHWVNKLINELSSLESELVLILDDYHLIHDETNHKLLAKVLEYMPACMHVIVSGRTAPPLPTARLLVRRELLEVTARDLAFDRDETSDYLQNIMELMVGPEDLALLHSQTEGWITGLQIIALMMRNGLDPKEAFTSLQAKDADTFEDVFSYFVEEVVGRQPQDMQDFLMRTSILHELSADLCNAVLQRQDCAEVLARVEQTGLFIAPMSEDRHWYRYHPLFAQCLRNRLASEHPELLTTLHATAAQWLEDHDFIERAIPHVLESGNYHQLTVDFERISYTETNISFLSSKALSILRWVDYIPRDELAQYPRLIMLIVIAEFHLARNTELQNLLHELGGALRDMGGLPAMQRKEMLTVRSLIAYMNKDFAQSIVFAEEALAIDNPNDIYFDGMLRYFISQAYMIVGNIQGAEEALVLSVNNAQNRGFVQESISALAALARVRQAQGQMNNAHDLLKYALDLAYERSASSKVINYLTASIDFVHDLMTGDMTLESYRINKHAFIAGQMASFDGWQFAPDFFVMLARHCLLTGSLEEAGDYIALERTITNDTPTYPFLEERLQRLELRLLFSKNELGLVNKWISRVKEALPANSDAVRSLQVINLARAYFMLGRVSQADKLLNEEIRDSAQIPSVEFKIEYYLIRSMVSRSMGSLKFARAHFVKALAIAESGPFVQPFIEWGPILHPAFNDCEQSIAENESVSTEFFVMARQKCFAIWSEFDRMYDWNESAEIPVLLESLSERETEVLRLVMRGYSPKSISAELCISYNTARTHVQSIYRKLGVHNREDALEIARTLLS